MAAPAATLRTLPLPRQTLVRHLLVARGRRRGAVRPQPRARPVRQPAARDDGVLLRRDRRADRADRAQRADLARPRRAHGGRRLHDRAAASEAAQLPARRARCSPRRWSTALVGHRSSARPPRGCAGPTSRARRSRSPSACRRWPTATTTFLGGENGLTVVAADAAAGARRDLPARALAGVDRVHRPRSSPTSCWPTSCAAASGARCGRCATTRSPPRCPACTWPALQVLAFVVSAACAGLAGGLFVVVDVAGRARCVPRSTCRSRCSPARCSAGWAASPARSGAPRRSCSAADLGRGPQPGRCRCRPRSRPTCRSRSTGSCSSS